MAVRTCANMPRTCVCVCPCAGNQDRDENMGLVPRVFQCAFDRIHDMEVAVSPSPACHGRTCMLEGGTRAGELIGEGRRSKPPEARSKPTAVGEGGHVLRPFYRRFVCRTRRMEPPWSTRSRYAMHLLPSPLPPCDVWRGT